MSFSIGFYYVGHFLEAINENIEFVDSFLEDNNNESSPTDSVTSNLSIELPDIVQELEETLATKSENVQLPDSTNVKEQPLLNTNQKIIPNKTNSSTKPSLENELLKQSFERNFSTIKWYLEYNYETEVKKEIENFLSSKKFQELQNKPKLKEAKRILEEKEKHYQKLKKENMEKLLKDSQFSNNLIKI